MKLAIFDHVQITRNEFYISPIMVEPFPNIPIFLVIGKQLLVVRTIPCIKVLVMIEFNDK